MLQFPSFRGPVKWFVISCFAIFIAQIVTLKLFPGVAPGIDPLTYYLGLIPSRLFEGHLYVLWTWVFLHSTGMVFHILFNMLAFWMFGSMIQDVLGERRFVLFCFFGALFSGLTVIAGSFMDEGLFASPTIGASGLVFAVVIAFARLYPNQTVIFYIFPMQMKYLAGLLVLIDLFFLATGENKQVSYVAHLAGALYGFVVIKQMSNRGSGGGWFDRMKEHFSAKKKKRHLRIVYPDQNTERRTYH